MRPTQDLAETMRSTGARYTAATADALRREARDAMTWERCAAEGMSQSEAAVAMGRSQAAAWAAGKRFGLRFRDGRLRRPAPEPTTTAPAAPRTDAIRARGWTAEMDGAVLSTSGCYAELARVEAIYGLRPGQGWRRWVQIR